MSGPYTLVIMAAGLGSRYGGGIKQLERMGAQGEIIMEYSIHDAIQAGFNEIIIILRREIEKDFMETVGQRIENACGRKGIRVSYAFQSTQDLPGGRVSPEGRAKPWGTGQAVLACREIVRGPFAVINADDYYGRTCFGKISAFLHQMDQEGAKDQDAVLCMAGFVLANTLSDNGGVTRGLCSVDGEGWLEAIRETKGIEKKTAPDGTLCVEAAGQKISADCPVSMNMWGFPRSFMGTLEEEFARFLDDLAGKEREEQLTAEYLLPTIVGNLLEQGRVRVKVLETDDHWFGVTYQEDRDTVRMAFADLIRQGVYGEDLYADL